MRRAELERALKHATRALAYYAEPARYCYFLDAQDVLRDAGARARKALAQIQKVNPNRPARSGGHGARHGKAL